MSRIYFRPVDILSGERAERALHLGEALLLAGGPLAFQSVEILSRVEAPQVVPAMEVARDLASHIAPREALAGLDLVTPRVMGILNVTPDSFSDGGVLLGEGQIRKRAEAMIEAGADILDVGGESTRPGSDTVPVDEEIARVVPALKSLSDLSVPLSIDSRKPEVFRAAADAGATTLNDVSALTYDSKSIDVAAALGLPVILMHAQGDPKTMQQDPHYDDVLLDVYDWLEARMEACEAAGVPRSRIVIDPGIGFGKTLEHNLRLLGGLSLFHGLGCPILLGASRKSFIHKMAGAPDPSERIGGSLAAVFSGASQGVQIFRVHDVFETRQALTIGQGLARFS